MADTSGPVTLEAEYTSDETNTAVVTIASGTRMVVTQIAATCDNANSNDTGLRVGFGTSTTPTTTKVVLTHPGIAKGSGFSRGTGKGVLGIGDSGESLRITSEDPGGILRILVTYHTVESN